MAHTPSARKRIRQTETRTAINRARLSRVKTFLKKTETAIAGGNREEALAAFKAMQPEVHRGVTKGVLQKNTAARRLSRLAARIKAMAA